MNSPTSKAVNGPGIVRDVEALDGAGWRQTLKDLPVTILGSTVGYMVGSAAARALLNQYGTPGAPEWIQHVPKAIGAAHAIGVPLVQGRLNQVLKERREKARAKEFADRQGST